MINRAINTLMSDGKCTILHRHWCALFGSCTANTHVVKKKIIIYLFIGFDLENVGFASIEMVTELGLVVERTCFRRNQPAHFLKPFKSIDDILSNYTIQAACAHQRH